MWQRQHSIARSSPHLIAWPQAPFYCHIWSGRTSFFVRKVMGGQIKEADFGANIQLARNVSTSLELGAPKWLADAAVDRQ